MNIGIESIFLGFLYLTLGRVLVMSQKPRACCEEYCYESDNVRSQEEFFSSKTSYSIGKREDLGQDFNVPNCTADKIWLYIRHGSRLPKGREMKRLSQLEELRDEIIANYKSNSQPAVGAMCKNDLDLLKSWEWDKNITDEYDEFLTPQGWNEAKILAHRYRKHFPNIFKKTYDEKQFLFRYTNAHRTEASFKAFVEGLFGENSFEFIQTPPMDENIKMMMPYKFCPTDKEETAGASSEYGKYLASDIIKKLGSDVSERLGFKYPLKIQKVLDMYDMCIYYQSWNLSGSSPWCAAFTPSQIYDLEYLEDLRKYYESGPGREVNDRLLCELMNDMLGHLGNSEQPKAVTYLTHSSSYLLLLTSLGAFRDSEPLHADNYYRLADRKWRLSKIVPFASNFAAVKYDCPNEDERRKIRFFANEVPLELEGCDKGMCDWKTVQKRYKVYSEVNCDEYYCSKSDNGTESSSSIPLASIYLFNIILVTLFGSNFNWRV